jgi:hypothetical protein
MKPMDFVVNWKRQTKSEKQNDKLVDLATKTENKNCGDELKNLTQASAVSPSWEDRKSMLILHSCIELKNVCVCVEKLMGPPPTLYSCRVSFECELTSLQFFYQILRSLYNFISLEL